VENLSKLLFELSNEDRLRILQHIDREAMNVTNLSKALGLTTQECSRHLSRLGEVGLAKKDIEGLHRIGPFGKVVLKLLLGLRFVSGHSDYFTAHSLERLPPEFTSRIGDLAHSTHVKDVMAAFYNVDRVFEEAREHIWVITDQWLLGTWVPLTTRAIERKVKVKHLEPEDRVVSPKIKEGFRAEDVEAARRGRVTGLLEERVLDRLDICLYMSEKEVAGVAFPLLDGSFDYLGFTATDERSRKWCGDLFQYYWERARNRAKVAEELYRWVTETPKASYVLKNIAAGNEIVDGEELISELESRSLVKQGKLTRLGDIVLERLPQ